MRKMSVEEFGGKAWEYDKAKRQERRQDRSTRDRRRSGRGIWESKTSDE